MFCCLCHLTCALKSTRGPTSAQKPDTCAFAVLHSERVYLLNNLQYQNKKAVGILRKIWMLQQDLILSSPSCNRREQLKLKRLRRHLKDINCKEQAILGRLGQLSFQIQSQDRRMLVEAEGRAHFQYNESYRGRRHTPGHYLEHITETDAFSRSLGHGTIFKSKDVSAAASTLVRDAESATLSGNYLKRTEAVHNMISDLHLSDNEPLQTYPNIPRSSSVDSVDLDIVRSGSPVALPRLSKRNSL